MDFKHKKEAEAIEGYGARSARVGACDILTLNRYVPGATTYSNV